MKQILKRLETQSKETPAAGKASCCIGSGIKGRYARVSAEGKAEIITPGS